MFIGIFKLRSPIASPKPKSTPFGSFWFVTYSSHSRNTSLPLPVLSGHIYIPFEASGHEIFGSLATLWGLPVDILGGDLDVAGFAMNAAKEKKTRMSIINLFLVWAFGTKQTREGKRLLGRWGREREGLTFAR